MKKTWLVAIAIGLSAVSANSSADESFIVTIQKKQEEKKKLSSWSLSEWLATKERIKLMDMWLALHTPSPYEFQLGGYYQSGQSPVINPYTGFSGHFTAMASIIGIELNGESVQPDHSAWSALLNLRVFGYNEQGAHITLKGGLRNLFADTSYRNPFFGGEIAVPFARTFGIEGSVLRYFDVAGGDGTVMSAWRYAGGAYIDFDFVRLRGTMFYEPSLYGPGIASYTQARQGFLLGTTLFF